MAIEYGRSLDVTKAMFYSHKHEYKHFIDITPEDIERITKFAELKRTSFKENKRLGGIEDKAALYKETLDGLVRLGNNNRLNSYDEKIFYLINVVDPELKAEEMVRKAVIMPLEVIYSIKNSVTKASAMALRKKQLEKLKAKITSELGFYDKDLISYETYYRKMYVCDEEMLAAAKQSL